MSDAKFASITSALLVRKGEAAPSLIGAAGRPMGGTLSVPVPMPLSMRRPKATVQKADKHEKHDEHASVAGDRRRRVVITLTGEEYQRLGIVAAKKDTTRHDMVRDVLFEQLDAYAREAAADCACIRSGAPCDCAAEDMTGEGPAKAAGDIESESAVGPAVALRSDLEAAY